MPTAYSDYSAATTAVSGDRAGKVQPDEAARCEKVLGIFGIVGEETATHREADRICSLPEFRRTFWDTFGHPRSENLVADNFAVKAFPVIHDFLVDRESGCSRSTSSRTRRESAELSSAE